MTRLRRQGPRRYAPPLVVLAMLVTFLPHCLFGCSMGMTSATPVAITAVMDCCDAACPMNHADECLGSEEDANAPDAVVEKNAPSVPPLASIGIDDAPAPTTVAQARAFTTDGGPLPPPVPLHLLNAQFLI